MAKAATDIEGRIREIRGIRRAALIVAALFAAWWTEEFLTYGGRTGFDAYDFALIPILATGAWLVWRALRARCPECGNTFFVNRGLPIWFHFSLECPYCSFSLKRFSSRMD